METQVCNPKLELLDLKVNVILIYVFKHKFFQSKHPHGWNKKN